jgi:hypothetical protein
VIGNTANVQRLAERDAGLLEGQGNKVIPLGFFGHVSLHDAHKAADFFNAKTDPEDRMRFLGRYGRLEKPEVYDLIF